MLGKHSITELHPSPMMLIFLANIFLEMFLLHIQCFSVTYISFQNIFLWLCHQGQLSQNALRCDVLLTGNLLFSHLLCLRMGLIMLLGLALTSELK
jgi:hypothetical protein